MTITLFSVINKLNHIHRKIFRRSHAPLDIQSTLLDEVLTQHENIVGRNDISDRVPLSTLEGVEEEDVELVAELGAKLNDEGKWVVPTGMDLEPFKAWWPLAPADLRDTAVRMKLTKDGRRIESYVLPEDQGKGNDSLGTITSFAMLPMIAALSFLLWHIYMPFGYAALLLAIPELYALGQGESPATSFRAAILLVALPLWLAFTYSVPGTGGPMSAVSISTLFTNFSPYKGLAILAGVLILLFIMAIFGGGKSVGGKVEKMKGHFKWLAIFLAGGFVMSHLSHDLAPLAIFAIACMYPMHYTNQNFIARNVQLKEQGERFNLSTQGILSLAHVELRANQAMNALMDKTPVISLGVASGYLSSAKKYEFAPDALMNICISMRDLTKHLIVWGKTGIGKTEGVMRVILKAFAETNFGGALVMCGKGSLAREVAKLLHLRIRPGLDLGPFEGLNSQDVTEALFAIGSKDDMGNHQIWEEGAQTLLLYVAVIHEALCHHEKAKHDHAIHQTRLIETLITQVQLEIISIEQEIAVSPKTEAIEAMRERVSHLTQRLAVLRGKHQRWADERDKERRWFWAPDGMSEVKVLCGAMEGRSDGRYQIGPDLERALNELGVEADSEPVADGELDAAARFAERMATHPHTIHPGISNKTSDLSMAVRWMKGDWAVYAPEQRSSFIMNVDKAINPLMQGRYLKNADGLPWRSMEHGVDVTRCLYGERVGIDLPEIPHGRSGRVITALLKQRVYRLVRQRQAQREQDWLAEGQRHCMMVMDECQLLIGREEIAILPIARSLGLMCVMATQNYEGLISSIGDETRARSFMDNFNSTILMESTTATYNLVKEDLGTAEMTKFHTLTQGIDYDGAIENLRNSPLNDMNHPGRAVMNKLERAGAGRLTGIKESVDSRRSWRGQKRVILGDTDVTQEIEVPTGGKRVVEDVFKIEEYKTLVVGPGKAFILVRRGGIKRCDVATLHRVGADELAEIQSKDKTNKAA